MQENISSKYTYQIDRTLLAERLTELENSAIATKISVAKKTWPDQYLQGWDWIENFIMQPHADIGRKGAVCPFAKQSHNIGGLHFSTLNAGGIALESYIQLILQLPSVYQHILQKSGVSPALFSLVIFIEGIADTEHYQYIDLTHSIVKPLFMNAGLMLGEFRPNSPAAGVHSEIFRPMTSPMPCFVIRAIAPHDKLFFSKPGAVTRDHEIDCYLKWIGHTLNEQEMLKIEKIRQASKVEELA